MKRTITFVIALVIMGTIMGFIVISSLLQGNPTNFEECKARNYPIQETNPPTCVAPNGQRFTEGE